MTKLAVEVEQRRASADAESADGRRDEAKRLAPPHDGMDRVSGLSSTIENVIIPRLVLAHVTAVASPCPAARLAPSADEVDRFAELASGNDVPQLLEIVEGMARAGLTLEGILLDLVSPAARLLGQRWLEDTKSFAEVTLGLGALQRVIAVLGHDLEPPLTHRGLVVLLAAPGEQHTLAIHVLGELVRQDGWGAHVDATLPDAELLDLVRAEPVSVVGITMSDCGRAPWLRAVVPAIRRAAANDAMAVWVGGHPGLEPHAAAAGATYCASIRDALAWLRTRDTSGDSFRRDTKLPS